MAIVIDGRKVGDSFSLHVTEIRRSGDEVILVCKDGSHLRITATHVDYTASKQSIYKVARPGDRRIGVLDLFAIRSIAKRGKGHPFMNSVAREMREVV